MAGDDIIQSASIVRKRMSSSFSRQFEGAERGQQTAAVRSFVPELRSLFSAAGPVLLRRDGVVPGERHGAAAAVRHPAAALPGSGERRDAGNSRRSSAHSRIIWVPCVAKFESFMQNCK